MIMKCLIRMLVPLVLLPALAFAGTLDDLYLSRLAPQVKSLRLSVAPGLDTTAAPVRADRSLTSLHRSLKRDWTRLEPTTQKVLASYVSRPTLFSAQIYASPGGHFNIHYSNSLLSGDHPDLTDADHNGVPDWVETVAAVFDNVYAVEVKGMGFRSPPVIKYDVYLLDLVSQRAYGFTDDVYDPNYPPTGVVSVASYIEIDKAFTDPMFTVDGTYTPVEMLEVTAAHEYHHAIQFGYNYYFDPTFAEMTSTWMEDEVYDGVNQSYEYLPSYLPQASTIAIDAPEDGGSEYGRWVFNRYLAESHSHAPTQQSSDFLRAVWERIGSTPAPLYGNNLPMLPAVMATISVYGGTLSDDFLGFAKRLYREDWASHDALDTARIAAVSLNPQATYSNYPVNTTAISTFAANLSPYTFAYYKFRPDASALTDLTLNLANVPTAVQIVAIKKGTDGSFSEYSLNRAAGSLTIPGFNTPATSEVQLVVCNNNRIAGDCNGSGIVSIGEVQTAINMYLGVSTTTACMNVGGTGTVSISDLQKVVSAFLGT